MSDNKSIFQNIFGRLFKNEQEKQVMQWLEQVAQGGVAAQNGREALKSISPELLLPILAKLADDYRGKAVGSTADKVYKEIMEAAASGRFSQAEDLTIGAENLTPREYLQRYGPKGFEQHYGLSPTSMGGQTLLGNKDARASRR
jgi:uncharacterized protein (DUF697 family)